MTPAALAQSGRFAAAAAHLLHEGQARTFDHLDPDVEKVLSRRQPVYLAQGIIMADLHLNPEQAIALLRAHAYTHDRPVNDVAQDVVNGAQRVTL
jgi:AmiR/NasT family two-component response regulator